MLNLMLLIGLGLLILKAPEVGLVFCTLIGPLLKGILQPYFAPIDLTGYLFVITTVSVILQTTIARKHLPLPDSKINFSVLIFLTLLWASLLWSPLPERGLEMFLRFALLDISMIYLVYMWAIDLNRIKRLLLLFAGTMLIYGTALFLWLFLFEGLLQVRWRGVFLNTSAIGVGLTLAIGILASFSFIPLIKGGGMKAALGVLIAFSLISLIATGSRGPLIAFTVGALVMFFTFLKKHRSRIIPYAIATLLTGLMAFSVLPRGIISRYLLLFDPSSSSIAVRLSQWRFVLEHFTEWFLHGVGLFGFGPHYWPGKTTFGIFGAHPHNIFLDVFSHVGFFGLLVFVWLIGLLFYKGIRLLRNEERSFYLLSLASLVGLTASLVNALFSSNLISTRPIWFFGGIIISLERNWRQGNEGMHSDLRSTYHHCAA